MQKFSNKYGARENEMPTSYCSYQYAMGVSWTSSRVSFFPSLYHFWNGCSTNAGSNLIKDKVMSRYPMVVWKTHLLSDFNPNVFSGNPKSNSS